MGDSAVRLLVTLAWEASVLGLPAHRRADCLSRRASLTGMYLIVVHLIGVHLVGVLGLQPFKGPMSSFERFQQRAKLSNEAIATLITFFEDLKIFPALFGSRAGSRGR